MDVGILQRATCIQNQICNISLLNAMIVKYTIDIMSAYTIYNVNGGHGERHTKTNPTHNLCYR